MRKELIAARKAKGFTRKYMAEKLGITTSFYGKIERGERNPTLGLAKAIADILEAQTIDSVFLATEGTKRHLTTPPATTAR